MHIDSTGCVKTASQQFTGMAFLWPFPDFVLTWSSKWLFGTSEGDNWWHIFLFLHIYPWQLTVLRRRQWEKVKIMAKQNTIDSSVTQNVLFLRKHWSLTDTITLQQCRMHRACTLLVENSYSTRWGIITGTPCFKRHNVVNIRFIYMKISENITERMLSLHIWKQLVFD